MSEERLSIFADKPLTAYENETRLESERLSAVRVRVALYVPGSFGFGMTKEIGFDCPTFKVTGAFSTGTVGTSAP